ncbi:1-aminocyclopropane-1-carboxylate oxidase homolog 3-like [Cryptomeria japonica]|uniref:1-aminocyclopropane-1-carboxylate oxidase homolog 3-like n=1 Tax=Cryptomeria japonica TaxID=3369 RepID=UPI0027DA526D|nr:1-aminocyclopropane-1-carboxylate oxidase homolog 3-like [Cryptomeria japonica]XP_059063735.1 1-aminocyclopropane-1-carboxylate oxidase homolog 3-like [Cryptomeria japonica]
MKYYSHDYNNPVKFAPSFNLHKQTAVDWKDALRMTYAPVSPQYQEWPAALREESIDFCKHERNFGAMLLTLLSEALNLAPDYLTETINCMDRQIMMMNFYPPCPQPDLTLGTSIHSDMGSITVLLLDEVGGLQVKHNGDWVGVDPIHGAFVIIIGDQLEAFNSSSFVIYMHAKFYSDCCI